MKRWAANLFCLFSLLVFVSSVTLWMRCYDLGETIDWVLEPTNSEQIAYFVGWDSGVLFIARLEQQQRYKVVFDSPVLRHMYQEPLACLRPTALPELSDERVNVLVGTSGFGYGSFDDTTRGRSRQCIALPLWLFLPAAVPPFLWWRKWRNKGGRGFPVSFVAENAKTN